MLPIHWNDPNTFQKQSLSLRLGAQVQEVLHAF